MRTSSIRQRVPSKPSSILDMVSWKISGAELIPSGSLLKQKRPNGVTKVVSSFDLASKRIKFGEYLTISQFSEVLIPSRYWVYLTLDCFVKVSHVNTDTHTAIWFTDRNDICTPFSWRCYRRDEALLLFDFLPLESVDVESFWDCRYRKA